MSDEEITTNNQMDTDEGRTESSSSPAQASSTVMLDLGIGSGHISGSDDEDLAEPLASKSSTPDSTTLPSLVPKKPSTTKKPTLTKTKSALVNYDRDSDDDEHTDEEEMEDENQEEEPIDEESNSNSAVVLHASADSELMSSETGPYNEQSLVTSDLLNVTPFKADDASPSSRDDLTASHHLIFPEDAEIRIPPLPSKTCPSKLEAKFKDYYERLNKTGINQNAQIQALKDFRNPSMYEKLISHLQIDEIGTNFPQELYDPHWWGKESYYEELGKAQRMEMDRREKERRERTKIGFTPGVKKPDQIGVVPLSTSETGVEKRKNRFDQ